MEKKITVMLAWEPIPEPEEGTCGTCRHLDRSCGYLTYPMKYRCEKTGEIHTVTHYCDVPAFVGE